MRTLVMVTSILCYILYMHYVAAIKLLQSGVEVDYDISASNMCYDGEFPLKMILNIPIGQCIVECETRQRCHGMNYRKNDGFSLCKLLSISNVEETEFTTGDCVLVRRSDIKVKKLPCDNCEEEQVCNVAIGLCVIKECEFPSIQHGLILGNSNEIGSRLRVKCDTGYTTTDGRKSMVCGDDGRWSELPICEADTTQEPSEKQCVAVAGSTADDTWCMNNCNNPEFQNCPSADCECDPPAA